MWASVSVSLRRSNVDDCVLGERFNGYEVVPRGSLKS